VADIHRKEPLPEAIRPSRAVILPKVVAIRPKVAATRLKAAATLRAAIPEALDLNSPQSSNGMAIAGFVCAFLCSILGLILSGVALSQINSSGGRQKGKGLAIAGIVISIISLVAGILFQVAAHS